MTEAYKPKLGETVIVSQLPDELAETWRRYKMFFRRAQDHMTKLVGDAGMAEKSTLALVMADTDDRHKLSQVLDNLWGHKKGETDMLWYAVQYAGAARGMKELFFSLCRVNYLESQKYSGLGVRGQSVDNEKGTEPIVLVGLDNE